MPVPTALTFQKASVFFNTAESSYLKTSTLYMWSHIITSALLFEIRCLVQYNLPLVRPFTVYRQDQKQIDQKFSHLSGNPITEF
jgi:hypothetical protein